MFYICIHNDKVIEYAEEYAYETEEEKRWADMNYRRLVMECFQRGDELWTPYYSKEKQFSFPGKKK